MTIAKEEFLAHIKNVPSKVKAARIFKENYFNEFGPELKNLKVGYSEQDFEQFLNSLDFHYDSGYGGQELYGIIWYEDGTWSERGEYDGSEWWEHQVIPDIPEELK